MAEQPIEAQNGQAKQPPFVQIVKTESGCQVATNLVDAFLAMALLEMGKQRLIDSMKPKLVKHNGNLSGLIRRMQG